MIVCDASAMVAVLSGLGPDPLADRLRGATEAEIHAPHLIDMEVAQALRGLVRRGVVDAGDAYEALILLSRLRMRRYRHVELLERVWDLRDNFSAYDAAYVALAEILEASLLTVDRRLARAADKLVDVELYA